MTRQRSRPARGTTLVEALITFLVLSLGLLAVSRVQGQLRLAADTGRERSEAVRLAQEDLEQLRGYATIDTVPGVAGRSYADIVATERVIDANNGPLSNTVYRLRRSVAPARVASARQVSVEVAWADRAGQPQTVVLDTLLAADDPALSGALGIAPAVAAVNGPLGRAVQIPRDARDLGNGRSALAMDTGSGAVTFVFDNATGAVLERCAGTAPGQAATGGTGGSTAGCRRLEAYLLSGVVRFATGANIDLIEPVRRASVVLRSVGGAPTDAPECSTTPVETLAGDHYLQYVCIVYPSAGGRWSGDSMLVPDGWALGGTGVSGLRTCNENGLGPTVAGGGAAAEILGSYTGVSGTLVNQNFRVIRADLACPA